MANSRQLDNFSEEIFESALSKIKGQLDVKRMRADEGLSLLRRFEELKKYESLFVHKITGLKGEGSPFIILLIEKHLTITTYRRSGRRDEAIEEIEPVVIFSMPADIGRVIIRKETVADKIADWLYKVDIDFKKFPNFSNDYFVAAEKPDFVKEKLPEQLIRTLDKIKDMTVEINGKWGLLRSEKNLTEDLLLLLISMGNKMTQ